VLVRWRDWLQNGFDTAGIPESQRRELFLDHSSIGRERFNGRAAELLAPQLVDRGRAGSVLQSDSSASWGLSPSHAKKCKPKDEFADECCREALLRSRHVHVDPYGRIVPGTCAGIVLGVAGNGVTVADVWRQLNENWASRPVVGSLVRGGPMALLEETLRSSKMEYSSGEYAGKCHLCWQTRRLLASLGRYPLELPIDNDAGKKSSKVDA
jgi:hypothetical protein